jgi:hypothetical protein
VHTKLHIWALKFHTWVRKLKLGLEISYPEASILPSFFCQEMRRILAMMAQRGELSAKQTITAKKIIYELNKQSVQVTRSHYLTRHSFTYIESSFHTAFIAIESLFHTAFIAIESCCRIFSTFTHSLIHSFGIHLQIKL